MKNRATAENTVFLSIAAYEDYETKTRALRKSAEENGVPLELCDAGEPWYGFYRNKIIHMRSHLRRFHERGKRFAFVLDARDVLFIEPVDVVLQKFNALNKGRAIFNKDVPGKVWPSHNEILRREVERKMNSEHARLNAGMLAGAITTLLEIYDLAVSLRTEFVEGNVIGDFARKLYGDIGTAHIDDDQHLFQIGVACRPELFQIDCHKELFAVLMAYPEDIHEHSRDPGRHDVINGAAMIHSPWLSREPQWERHAVRNFWKRS